MLEYTNVTSLSYDSIIHSYLQYQVFLLPSTVTLNKKAYKSSSPSKAKRQRFASAISAIYIIGMKGRPRYTNVPPATFGRDYGNRFLLNKRAIRQFNNPLNSQTTRQIQTRRAQTRQERRFWARIFATNSPTKACTQISTSMNVQKSPNCLQTTFGLKKRIWNNTESRVWSNAF